MKFDDKLLKQLTKDIGLIKSELWGVKSQLKNLTSLDVETYEVRPEYIRKLKKLIGVSSFLEKNLRVD